MRSASCLRAGAALGAAGRAGGGGSAALGVASFFGTARVAEGLPPSWPDCARLSQPNMPNSPPNSDFKIQRMSLKMPTTIATSISNSSIFRRAPG